MHSGTRGIQSTLAQLAAEGADATRVAAVAVSSLNAINAAMAPIVSDRGVGALYRRSLYLIRSDFPWLMGVYEGALAPGEFGPLQAALSRQTGAEAVLASDALLRTFHELLTSLIGGSLTERLLESVWDSHLASGDAVQEISP
jgi:hypothetical protein